MTVYTQKSSETYAGNGSTKVFTIPFPFRRNTDIRCYLDGTALVYGADYTVAGGTVTLATAPAAGRVLRIQRVVPLTQTLDLQAQGPFDPEALEGALDDLMMAIQQFNDNVAILTTHGDLPGGSLHALATDDEAGFVDPVERDRWNKHIADSGNPHGTSAADIGAAPAEHNHDDRYSLVDHNHDSTYATKVHTHDERYTSKEQGDNHETRIGDIEPVIVQVPPLVTWKITADPKITAAYAHVGVTAGNPHGVTPGMIGAADASAVAVALASKSTVGHTHGIADVVGLESALAAGGGGARFIALFRYDTETSAWVTVFSKGPSAADFLIVEELAPGILKLNFKGGLPGGDYGVFASANYPCRFEGVTNKDSEYFRLRFASVDDPGGVTPTEFQVQVHW